MAVNMGLMAVRYDMQPFPFNVRPHLRAGRISCCHHHHRRTSTDNQQSSQPADGPSLFTLCRPSLADGSKPVNTASYPFLSPPWQSSLMLDSPPSRFRHFNSMTHCLWQHQPSSPLFERHKSADADVEIPTHRQCNAPPSSHRRLKATGATRTV